MREWWQANPTDFTRVFGIYSRALDRGGYIFNDCDPLANFARRAVDVTADPHILREAVRGLAMLGYNHTRWYVRDVTVALLQQIRGDADAASALEGLQIAGPSAAHWTAGRTLLGALHPILRAGIPEIGQPRDPTAPPQGMWP